MTGGGPLNSTQTIVHYLYITGFRQFKMGGYASAMAYILVIIILIITLIQQRALRSEY